jgi:hypothetical protein
MRHLVKLGENEQVPDVLEVGAAVAVAFLMSRSGR